MSDSTAPRLFCFGLGYSATVLARRLLRRGWRVAGTTRTPEALPELRAQGIEAYLFAGDHPLADPAEALAGTSHLLSSVPPGEAGDPVLACHGRDIASLAGLAWVGYLSTTVVYGDTGGAWIDESAPIRPSGPRGRRRAEAERAWLALGEDHGLPVHLFRLGGIYGPGRNQLEALRSGRAKRIVKPGQVFGRIHVDDIAGVLEASMARPNPGAAYNLCDDEPAPPDQVIVYAAELLGLPPPPAIPYDTAELSPMARSFYADNKRCRNQRIKEELGVSLTYPSYREGLQALLESA
jgi:nucleoside-diphosphate-sugar epimerase